MPAQARSVVVHKFGGAALADAGAIASVVRLLALDRTGTRRVVAASALHGRHRCARSTRRRAAAAGDLDGAIATAREQRARHMDVATDLMLDAPAIAEQIEASFEELELILERVAGAREQTPRTRDEILARGERLTAAVVAAALEAPRLRAKSSMRRSSSTPTAAPATRRQTSRAPTSGARRAPAAARPRNRVVVPGFIGAAPTARSPRSDAAARISPRPCSHGRSARTRSRSGRTSPAAHRRSARRARRARHPAAPCARGIRAGVLRREGAAPPRPHAAAAGGDLRIRPFANPGGGHDDRGRSPGRRPP